MKNIYDIIAEQKAIVDVNIASYDLDHTICCLNNNEYYMQEGLGDSIKNGAKKVIEFIKQIIAKFRELVRRMINYFSGGRKPSVTMKDLKNAKVGEKKDDTKDDKKGESGADSKAEGSVYDKNIYKGKDPGDLNEEDILRGSLRTVNIIKYVGFDVKEKITDNFFSAVNSVSRNFTENYNDAGKLFINSIERTCFKGNGSFKKVKGIPISERISLEIGEPKEPVQMKVSEMDFKVIYSYVEADMKYGAADASQKGKGIKAFLTKTEQEATKNLNELKSKLEGINNNGGNIGEQSFGNIDKVVSMVSQFINFISTNVFKAYNALFAVIEQALNDYIRAYNIQI